MKIFLIAYMPRHVINDLAFSLFMYIKRWILTPRKFAASFSI